MQTRQLRLNNQHDFGSELKKYQGKKINIVLKNGQVIFGYLQNLSAEKLEIKNLSKKRFSFHWHEVDEILIEETN